MNNIYVDALPKSCKQCRYYEINSYSDILGYKTNSHKCVLNGSMIIGDCPLKPLSVALAKERKKVIERIRDLAEIYTEPSAKGFDFETYILTEESLNKILDKAERGSYE